VYVQDLDVVDDHAAALATTAPCTPIDFSVPQTGVTIWPHYPPRVMFDATMAPPTS
jgi:hypothetical protein